MRRDFNRVALGVGLGPLLSPPTSAPPKKFNTVVKNSRRTCNRINVPRKYGAEGRSTLYWIRNGR